MKMQQTRRQLIGLLLASLPALSLATTDWPSKPLRLIVGFPAGSSPDLTARALAEPLGGLIGYVVAGPFLSPLVYGAIFGTIAGSMVFLALHELMPSARRHARGHETVYGLVAGMAMMAMSLVLAN